VRAGQVSEGISRAAPLPHDLRPYDLRAEGPHPHAQWRPHAGLLDVRRGERTARPADRRRGERDSLLHRRSVRHAHRRGLEAVKPLVALAVILPLAARDPLAQRIAHTDPAKYRDLQHVHAGAGKLAFMELLGRDALNTNLLFVHRGVIQPKSGIGHHFHSHMEEMFFILDGQAQFTIDGRTSLIQGPAAAPCRMGHSHAIYNPTNRPVQWMNIAVGSIKGKYDNFDLGDDRADAALDAKPVFINARLHKYELPLVENLYGGKGTIGYKRALPPEVFY